MYKCQIETIYQLSFLTRRESKYLKIQVKVIIHQFIFYKKEKSTGTFNVYK